MNETPFHITMIDDDLNYLNVLSCSLEDSFRVDTFPNPEAALEFIHHAPTDAVLLGLHLQGTDGFSVCKSIKKIKHDLPVFFMSSDPDVDAIAESFETGGVDYFVKSISSRELKIRMMKSLKRLKFKQESPTLISCGDISMNTATHLVFIKGREVDFTPKEYDILRVLIENQNRILTKNDLLTMLWKDVCVDANNIDTHMFHIRKKFKLATTRIQTIKGLGYILNSRPIV